MMRRRHNTRGFTLVEMMIAVAISLILLTGVLHIVLSNRNSLRTQNALADLQSRARLLNVTLDDTVASAGYHSVPSQPLDAVFKKNTGSPAFKSNNAVVAANKNVLRVRFQAAGSLHDCFGNKVGHFPDNQASAVPARISTKRSNFALRHENKTLKCKPYDTNMDVDTRNHTLLKGVRHLRLRFGLNTQDNRRVDTYTDDLDKSQQEDVVTIRLQVLLQTRKKRVLSTPINREFKFVDGSNISIDKSRRAFLMFDRTVVLRNQL